MSKRELTNLKDSVEFRKAVANSRQSYKRSVKRFCTNKTDANATKHSVTDSAINTVQKRNCKSHLRSEVSKSQNKRQNGSVVKHSPNELLQQSRQAVFKDRKQREPRTRSNRILQQTQLETYYPVRKRCWRKHSEVVGKVIHECQKLINNHNCTKKTDVISKHYQHKPQLKFNGERGSDERISVKSSPKQRLHRPTQCKELSSQIAKSRKYQQSIASPLNIPAANKCKEHSVSLDVPSGIVDENKGEACDGGLDDKKLQHILSLLPEGVDSGSDNLREEGVVDSLTDDIYGVRKYMFLRREEDSYSCAMCAAMSFSGLGALRQHVIASHQQQSGQSGASGTAAGGSGLYCGECEVTFPTSRGYHQHVCVPLIVRHGLDVASIRRQAEDDLAMCTTYTARPRRTY